VIADRDGFAVYVSEQGGPAKEIVRDVDALSIGAARTSTPRGSAREGLSADEDLLCVSAAQDGDNIRRRLLVLDISTGRVVGSWADGPGLRAVFGGRTRGPR